MRAIDTDRWDNLDHDGGRARVLQRRWLSYAATERTLGHLDHEGGDRFGQALRVARAEALDRAVTILDLAADLSAAVDQLMATALGYSVPDAPLIGFDQAALSYTKARKLRQCAWEIDPKRPAVQPRWSWD